MITVVGEALVDLVIPAAGAVEAKLGGAPFNTARTCGRLGAPVRFVGAIGRDRFGERLAEQLRSDGVDTSVVERVDAPTTLAAAELDVDGAATYRFYIEGTSAPLLQSIPDGAGDEVVFTGGLGLVLEPMASVVRQALGHRVDGRMLMVDVNCRPLVIPDRQTYVKRVHELIAGATIVKVSDEDLDYLAPGIDPIVAARGLLRAGPSSVLLTRGGDGVLVLSAADESTVLAERVVVVDTIGAGDAFGGGFLSWWHAAGFGVAEAADHAAVEQAVRAANQVAAVVVTRRGAEPPMRSDLPADWSP
jgi:fructokinase